MTSTGADLQAFARLIESLTPWLDQVVIIGGWAHRLHRLHPAAQTLDYAPLTTLDADIALPIELKVEGQNIYQRAGKRVSSAVSGRTQAAFDPLSSDCGTGRILRGVSYTPGGQRP